MSCEYCPMWKKQKIKAQKWIKDGFWKTAIDTMVGESKYCPMCGKEIEE